MINCSKLIERQAAAAVAKTTLHFVVARERKIHEQWKIRKMKILLLLFGGTQESATITANATSCCQSWCIIFLEFRNYQKLKLLLYVFWRADYDIRRCSSINKVIPRFDRCCPIRTSIEFGSYDGTFMQSTAHRKYEKKITTINELLRSDSVMCASCASKMEYSFSYFFPFRSNNTFCWHTTQRGLRSKREKKNCFGAKWRQTTQQMP